MHLVAVLRQAAACCQQRKRTRWRFVSETRPVGRTRQQTNGSRRHTIETQAELIVLRTQALDELPGLPPLSKCEDTGNVGERMRVDGIYTVNIRAFGKQRGRAGRHEHVKARVRELLPRIADGRD